MCSGVCQNTSQMCWPLDSSSCWAGAFGGPPMFGPSCRSSVVDLPASRLSKGSTVAARTVLIGTVKSYSAVKGFGPQA